MTTLRVLTKSVRAYLPHEKGALRTLTALRVQGLSTTGLNCDKDLPSPPPPREFPPNSSIVPQFVNNRNPRNLEKLRIAEKAVGWTIDKPDKSFWNKLIIEVTGKHITAKVFHVSGKIPVSASTNEWCIKKFLYSTRDNVAAKTVGQILAHRCLQMGLTEVACFISEEDRKKEKVSLIIEAIQDGGVVLEEPGQYDSQMALNHYMLPEKSWEVYEEELAKGEEIMQLAEKAKKSSKQKQK